MLGKKCRLTAPLVHFCLVGCSWSFEGTYVSEEDRGALRIGESTKLETYDALGEPDIVMLNGNWRYHYESIFYFGIPFIVWIMPIEKSEVDVVWESDVLSEIQSWRIRWGGDDKSLSTALKIRRKAQKDSRPKRRRR